MHSLKVRAVQIQQKSILQKIYNQWEDFLKTMEAFSDEKEAEYLKQLITDHHLIETYNKNLPYFYTPSEDVQILMATDTPCHIVFHFIIQRLSELHIIREFIYTTQQCLVIVWMEDYFKLSKNLKAKLKRYW